MAPYVYASAAEDAQAIELIVKLAGGEIDAIAFTSKAQVQRLKKLAREKSLDEELRTGLDTTRVAAIGPVVAAELEASGVRVDAMPAGQLLDEATRHGAMRTAGTPKENEERARDKRNLEHELERRLAAAVALELRNVDVGHGGLLILGIPRASAG